MNPYIERPDGFFREVHPEHSKGSIVLARSIKKKLHYSQIRPNDAEKVFKLSYKVPDLYYSVASFTGMPLLTNFENIRCLYLRFSWTSEKKNQVLNALISKGFPEPTAVVTEGDKLTFFWMLEKLIKCTEFHKVFLLQNALYQTFYELSPCRESLEISNLIPLIGTVNSRTRGYVRLINYSGLLLKNDFAERYLLRFGVSDYENLKKHAQAILELHALLNSRFMTWSINNTCEDWLIFFGASLCHFCTSNQLAKELQAIAISLESKKRSIVKEKYGKLISDIASTAVQGYVKHEGQHLSLDNTDWFSLVYGKLNVTRSEVQRLGLNVIVDCEPSFTGSIIDISNIQPVGEFEFIPMERLMIKEVA